MRNGLGLIYMNARYYLLGIGRFASPDTIVPDPADPQSLNRYSYGLNNPVTYIDPSGHSYVNFDNSAECPIEQCGLNPYESENGAYQGEDLYENYSYEEVTMMQLFWLDTRGGDSALREGFYNELNYIARSEYDECGPWCSTYTDEGQLYFETGLDPDFLAGLGSGAAAMVTGIRPGDPSGSSIRVINLTPEDIQSVGRSGSPNVRELAGGEVNARQVFEELTVSYERQVDIPEGVYRVMPDGTVITFRPVSSERLSQGRPTVQFNFPDVQGTIKWKFWD